METVFGTLVERVYPRTVAERVGLLKDDLLLTINGQTIFDPGSLHRVAGSLRIGQQVNVTVIRQGKRKSLAAKITQFSSRVFHDRWAGGRLANDVLALVKLSLMTRFSPRTNAAVR